MSSLHHDNVKKTLSRQSYIKNSEPTRFGFGFCCGLFLGLIGITFGFNFDTHSLKRKTFFKGWWIAFIVKIILSIIIYFLPISISADLLSFIRSAIAI